MQWDLLKELFLKNLEMFTPLIKAGGDKLFKKYYCLVCTRCYGYYLNYTFMAPVADMFNHDHNNDAGLILVNKELHTNPLKQKSYFKSNKYLNDVSIVYNDENSEADQKAKADMLTQGYKATP